MSTTEESYFRSETADVDLLENNREVYPLNTQEQINVYNAKIISIMRSINAIPVPRFEGHTIGYMPEAYKEKAKTLILRLLNMYKQIEGANGKIIGEDTVTNILFGFNHKYKAELNFDWEKVFGKETVQKPYGTYRSYGGKKRTHKRKTHVNKSRKNKKKRGNK